MPWPTPLDESIVAGQTGHLTDHEALHASWNNSHAQKVSANLTLDYDHGPVIMNTAGGNRTVTVPLTSATGMDGHAFVIKSIGANQTTVNLTGADTFDDGTTSKTLGTLAVLGIFSVADAVWYIAGERGSVS